MSRSRNSLLRKRTITTEDLHELLKEEVNEQERRLLFENSKELVISESNRNTIIRMLDSESPSKDLLDCASILGLIENLQDYLNQFMKDQPAGHKWIIISCVFLTFVLREPMHPQSIVKWKKEDRTQTYYCPAYSDENDSTCRYCVCRSEECCS